MNGHRFSIRIVCLLLCCVSLAYAHASQSLAWPESDVHSEPAPGAPVPGVPGHGVSGVGGVHAVHRRLNGLRDEVDMFKFMARVNATIDPVVGRCLFIYIPYAKDQIWTFNLVYTYGIRYVSYVSFCS
jgi:hypothetical protein